MSNQEKSVEILSELLTSIKQRGYKKTLQALKVKGVNTPNSQSLPSFHSFVINNVCEVFDITTEELLTRRYVRGKQKYAIGFCVYYIYQDISIGEMQKSIFVNKNKTLLSKYRQIIIDLKDAHKSDQSLIDIKKTLDKRISSYMNKN
jgi:hypothetical protein